jgi:hypothetical protein
MDRQSVETQLKNLKEDFKRRVGALEKENRDL